MSLGNEKPERLLLSEISNIARAVNVFLAFIAFRLLQMTDYLEILYLISFTGILAVAYSYLLSGQILSASPGNSRMQEIADAI